MADYNSSNLDWVILEQIGERITRAAIDNNGNLYLNKNRPGGIRTQGHDIMLTQEVIDALIKFRDEQMAKRDHVWELSEAVYGGTGSSNPRELFTCKNCDHMKLGKELEQVDGMSLVYGPMVPPSAYCTGKKR